MDFFRERARWRGGRTSQKDFARFLEISLGSCFELETQLRIANKRKYSSQLNFDELLKNIISLQKRIFGLRKKVLSK
ncbi:four helix bundle protein [Lutibacter agarilyticus]|uniref:four helix bundle protein n=1 Tax=Lutibacter agarilyticus TaxID=1109740 RepID=UPI0015963A8F